MNLSLRTLQRWTVEGEIRADARSTTVRPVPANALTPAERQAILTVCNSPEHAHLPPSQIVPRLADQGRYLASEATFYRVLRAAGQQHHRGRSLAARKPAQPTTHVATGVRQVWSWDITYLPSPVRGQYYYLYLIEDIYSRKAVGWEVYEQESGEMAAVLLQRSVIREACVRQPLVLHSDNGAPMKSMTLLSKMYELGVTPSRGKQRQPVLGIVVSHDEVLPALAARWLCRCGCCPKLGAELHPLVQHRTPAQSDSFRDASATASRTRYYAASEAPCRVSASARAASGTLGGRHAKLDADRRCDAESGAVGSTTGSSSLKQVYATTTLKNAASSAGTQYVK